MTDHAANPAASFPLPARLSPRRRALSLRRIAPLLILFGVLAWRTSIRGAAVPQVDRAAHVEVPAAAAERLAGALRIRTVSPDDPRHFDGAPFRALHDYLHAQFPTAHAELEREVVNDYSLLYTWHGSDPSLAPILLLGHLDVVPVETGTEGRWQQAPFGGHVAGGFIWGRGAIDDKASVVGTLEAIELLLREGFRPERTVYLAYGHDEEVGGTAGAQQIAALLRSRGVKLEMVLDEGGVIGDGLLPGVSAPVALIGIAEKGFLTLELSVRTAGGHSSLPPRQSAVGILSAAVARLEENPMPVRLPAPTRALFEHIAPASPLAQRAVFSNLWLSEGLVLRKLQQQPRTNAMVRTTAAATLFNAGTKDNVLPSQARAVVNFRILPGDSIAEVKAHVRRVIDDPRITIHEAGRFSAEPAPRASTESPSFRVLERTIRSVNPDTVVAPYLVVVVTDSRHFLDLSANVLRFLPIRLTPEDLERMHGANERISVRGYEDVIRTYRALIVNAASQSGSSFEKSNQPSQTQREGQAMNAQIQTQSQYFPTETRNLPTAGRPEQHTLSDGEAVDLRIAPVAKRIGDAEVYMLAYNGSIPGPTLRVREGSEVIVDVVNDGDMEATVHWHGLRLSNRYDGTTEVQKAMPIGGGFRYRLKFPDPGVYWYHPHIREDYAQELGLYGNIVVEPADADYWPKADRELTVTLDDILIENEQVAPFRRAEPTHTAMGRFGNVLLVNGETEPQLQARPGEVVRLFLTNTANTRVFNVALPGALLKRVGGDSGRVEHEELVESVIIAPSERVVVDARFPMGGTLTLEHRTPKRTYALASIQIDGTEPPSATAADFEQLRTNADMVQERAPV